MAELTANIIGADAEDVLMASTGVTGYPMPMELIRAGISKIALSRDGGHDIARAIMTTDTVPKEVAVSIKLGEAEITIGGIAKGSGMIHPNMATMLCFLTTDAALELDFLKSALKESVDKSINMIDIDLDTSPSDMTLLMANGLAGNKSVSAGSQEAAAFQQALDQVCIYLAKALARDGEGATKLIEVTVDGAATVADARLAAKAVVSSPLVKTAIYGTDPNWGRIVVAMGGCGVEIDESRIDLYVGEANPLKDGRRVSYDANEIVRVFQQSNVPVRLNLNMGTASATAWGCDLTEEYVSINSKYMT
jgi:glutamate N-acetyltransferase/amino-acid N-acetyltransferase